MVEQRNTFEGETSRVEDVLRPLASDVRLRIVRALVASPGKTLSYSELHRASGIKDSGQFSYHLRQLLDRFVTQTDDGYRLRYSAVALYQALLAGTALGENEPRTISTESPCPACDGLLEATYSDDMLRISCPDCQHFVHHVPFLPGGAEGKSDADLLRTFDHQTRSMIAAAVAGICPYCGGSMGHEFVEQPAGEDEVGDDPEKAHKRRVHCGNPVHYRCERCFGELRTGVGETLLDEPAVVSFYYDHGIDVQAVPSWELAFCVEHDAVTTRSTDPYEFEVSMVLGDERLRVTVDESLAVVDAERTETD
ncbi:ArsR/SmtB family transcription factor [Haloarchaeobius sp. DT45]|uniref:ArsR/SmtB family transcription factor n=1 Tax=Haloarchaeobius sp. DT45 TaxID=3446116 RepID=UPI003F6C3861